MKKKPKWFPISSSMIDRLTVKISNGGRMSMYIFRLTPFTRGYTSVIAGLLQVKAKVFFPITFFSALTWASVYVVIGNLIGPFWNLFEQNIHSFKYVMLIMLVIIAVMVSSNIFHSEKGKKGKCFYQYLLNLP